MPRLTFLRVLDSFRVYVGSENPTKIRATEKAFREVIPVVFDKPGAPVVSGFKVESNVGEQPNSSLVTLMGARHRAEDMAYLVREKEFKEPKSFKGVAELPAFFVGIEGGVEKIPLLGMGSIEWVHIIYYPDCAKPIFSSCSRSASTSIYRVPHNIATHIEQGMTMEEAVEKEMGISKIGSDCGLIGRLTQMQIVRETCLKEAIKLALATLPEVLIRE